MRAFLARIGVSAALVAAIGLMVAPASAATLQPGPTLVVANPNEGDMVTPGALVIAGAAYDPTATEGVGVDRVSVFLGDRDSGGMYLGDATLGQSSMLPTPAAQFATAGWTLTTPALKGAGDQHDLFVYARSAVTGDETVVTIPITIGEKVNSGTGGLIDVGSTESPAYEPPDTSGIGG